MDGRALKAIAWVAAGVFVLIVLPVALELTKSREQVAADDAAWLGDWETTKKHLFQRGLMPLTPVRGRPLTIVYIPSEITSHLPPRKQAWSACQVVRVLGPRVDRVQVIDAEALEFDRRLVLADEPC